MNTIDIEVGELETAPPGFVRIRLNSMADLRRVAAHFGEVVHIDKKDGPGELAAEYAVFHMGRVYFYEE